MESVTRGCDEGGCKEGECEEGGSDEGGVMTPMREGVTRVGAAAPVYT